VRGTRRRRARRILTDIALVVIVAAAYFGAARFGLGFAFEQGNVTAVWAPTGIALAAVVLGGYRMGIAVAVGAFLANAETDVSLLTSAGIAAGDTLEALAGAYLLNRVAFRAELERVRDVIALAVLGGVLSTMIAAAIGNLSLLADNAITTHRFPALWRTWWLGDLGGDLLAAPLVMSLITSIRNARRGLQPLFTERHPVELVAMLAFVSATGLLVFSQDRPTTYLFFPALIWAALRFGPLGASLASVLATGFALWFTDNGSGPFIGGSPDQELLRAQVFMAAAAVTSLTLASAVAERRRAHDREREIAETLQRSLLPPKLPSIPGVDLGAAFHAAGPEVQVGGDFYDVFPVNGNWAVVIGDVSGKGPEAAALTALARHSVRALFLQQNSPAMVLGLLNEELLQHPQGRFVTVVLGVLRSPGPSGASEFVLANGGHPPPLLLRNDGSVETVQAPGMLIGFSEAPGLQDTTVQLTAGDALFLYTDGVTDAGAPRSPLRPADLDRIVASCSRLPAQDAAERVERAAVEHAEGRRRDDLAVLVLRAAEPSQPEPA
jgi:serine phosphatase RsbU (regulator of sigma subunit)